MAGRSTESLDCIVTKSQRRIIGTWASIVALLIIVAVFESWILEHWSWLRFVVLVVIAVGALVANPASRDENRLNRAVERHPLLKLWFVVCAMAALGFAAATTIWHVPLNEGIGVRGLIAIFAVLLGPPIIAFERERFVAAGREEASNAI